MSATKEKTPAWLKRLVKANEGNALFPSLVVPEVIDRAQQVMEEAAEAEFEREGDEFTRGMNLGFTHGTSHKKRKFVEKDLKRVFKRWSKHYVEGYLVGYQCARS